MAMVGDYFIACVVAPADAGQTWRARWISQPAPRTATEMTMTMVVSVEMEDGRMTMPTSVTNNDN
jgi:hypothetical protein